MNKITLNCNNKFTI